jgi:hypothetical protein
VDTGLYGVLKAKTRRVVLKQLELVHFLVATHPSILDVAVLCHPGPYSQPYYGTSNSQGVMFLRAGAGASEEANQGLSLVM